MFLLVMYLFNKEKRIVHVSFVENGNNRNNETISFLPHISYYIFLPMEDDCETPESYIKQYGRIPYVESDKRFQEGKSSGYYLGVMLETADTKEKLEEILVTKRVVTPSKKNLDSLKMPSPLGKQSKDSDKDKEKELQKISDNKTSGAKSSSSESNKTKKPEVVSTVIKSSADVIQTEGSRGENSSEKIDKSKGNNTTNAKSKDDATNKPYLLKEKISAIKKAKKEKKKRQKAKANQDSNLSQAKGSNKSSSNDPSKSPKNLKKNESNINVQQNSSLNKQTVSITSSTRALTSKQQKNAVLRDAYNENLGALLPISDGTGNKSSPEKSDNNEVLFVDPNKSCVGGGVSKTSNKGSESTSLKRKAACENCPLLQKKLKREKEKNKKFDQFQEFVMEKLNFLCELMLKESVRRALHFDSDEDEEEADRPKKRTNRRPTRVHAPARPLPTVRKWLFERPFKLKEHLNNDGKFEIFPNVFISDVTWFLSMKGVRKGKSGDSQFVKNTSTLLYKTTKLAGKTLTGKPSNRYKNDPEWKGPGKSSPFTPDKYDMLEDLFIERLMAEGLTTNLAMSARLNSFRNHLGSKVYTLRRPQKDVGEIPELAEENSVIVDTDEKISNADGDEALNADSEISDEDEDSTSGESNKSDTDDLDDSNEGAIIKETEDNKE